MLVKRLRLSPNNDLLGVRGLVTALVQGDLISTAQKLVVVESRCDKAVTSPRTPKRRPHRKFQNR